MPLFRVAVIFFEMSSYLKQTGVRPVNVHTIVTIRPFPSISEEIAEGTRLMYTLPHPSNPTRALFVLIL